MTDYLPPALLEACIVVGASPDNLLEAANSNGAPEQRLLDPEVLHVLAPPFVNRPQTESEAARFQWKRRRSVVRRKTDSPPAAASPLSQGLAVEESEEGEDVSVPKSIDLMAIPQLCFPDGLQVTNEQRDEQFHFLIFTDILGNRTHGVVMQFYRPILEGTYFYHNGAGAKFSKLFSAYSFCVISKFPYFTALKDCLSCLSVQLRTCCLSDMEEKVKDFATRLSLVPIPPPGQLHLMFTLPPLTIVLPSQEDTDHPVIDLELHLPFLCFRPQQLLQVISCLLQEQRLVLLSANCARLTLVAESLMVFLQPFAWQQPYVPVLSRGMLDFLMAPTAFLMGCHLSHFEEVASETEGLILVNIDEGSISTSSSDAVELPNIPSAAAGCFTERCQSLQMHFDLDQCGRVSSCDINEQRTQRRMWQRSLNHEIQRLTMELMVNMFRDVSDHLNYVHRVFNSEEFLKSREPAELLFYKTVLETSIFHSFLKDRLNRKMDSYAQMELSTSPEMQITAVFDVPHRTASQRIQARTRTSTSERRTSFQRNTQLTGTVTSEPALKTPPKLVYTFKLPDIPASLSSRSVQRYYNELIQQLGSAICSVQNENSALLARYFYLRGFINAMCSRRLDALSDLQNLYKTDALILPTQLVTWLVDSLHQDETEQADQRPDLQGLILKVRMENGPLVQEDNPVKTFEFPTQSLRLHEFVRCVQESDIVKDVETITRLFNALTDGESVEHSDTTERQRRTHWDSNPSALSGRSAHVDPFLFRDFYNIWKEREAEAQDVNLPPNVIEKLDSNEFVFKLSSCVKTSVGVGNIAMTQKRLFLLTKGRPGYIEITKFRDIRDVRIASAPFLLVRIPSLRIRASNRHELFEANLKTETELWSLIVKEMWVGRKMADKQKDPQYMSQAVTTVLLMDTVVRCLPSHKSIIAASQLANFDKLFRKVALKEHKTTSETLKHKINPSLDLSERQTVDVLLYTPGQLNCSDAEGDKRPKLWVALSGGKVVVFDASSWSMLQGSIQVGRSQLNCMLGMVQEQVWIGSQDSLIYIIDAHSMSCKKQLTEHRHEVTGLAVGAGDEHSHHAYSCSCDGTVLMWDSASLRVKGQFHLKRGCLSSLQFHAGALWCCCGDSIVELRNDGAPQRTLTLPDDLHGQSPPNIFSCFIIIPQQDQVWTGCAKSGHLCVWKSDNHRRPSTRISLPGASAVTCMIRVKEQVWIGCNQQSRVEGQWRVTSQVLVVDSKSCTVTKQLLAHSDTIQALCSVEDRYVLSGSAHRDGKIAIWKVE